MATTTPGPNLTNIAFIGRQFIKYGSIALVVLIVGRTLLSVSISYWKATHPPAPPPPTMGFGALTPIAFPDQTDADKPSDYRLETATGRFPSFGDRAKVFLMPRSTPSLLADQEARAVAADFGFVFEPEVLDTETYRWTKSQPLESTLELDINNKHFSLVTDYLNRPEILVKDKLPDDRTGTAVVKNALRRSDLLPPDMSTASADVVYRKAIGGELQTAVSFSDADLLEINLNRTPIDNLWRMFTPAGKKGTVSAVISGALNGEQSIVSLEYQYQPVDYSQVHTYPLRSVEAAWKLLQAGEGYVAVKGDGDQAVIRDVTLGYFDSFTEQDYLQPIYVFSGDDGFLGYVPALDPRVYQTSQPSSR